MDAASDIPETYTGVSLWVVVPSPSWPFQLAPQQRALPLDRVAQVWELPAEMEMAVDIPETYTDVFLSVVVPSPSWPFSLFPQQRALPLFRATQA